MNNKPWYNNRLLMNLFSTKYFAFVVSLLLLITGILAIILGIQTAAESITDFMGSNYDDSGGHLLEAVDIILFSMVILILSGGIYKLFIGDQDTFKHISVLAELKTFKDLKILLWETILVTLTVTATLDFLLAEEASYSQLILPGGILILALALMIMKSGKLPSGTKGD